MQTSLKHQSFCGFSNQHNGLLIGRTCDARASCVCPPRQTLIALLACFAFASPVLAQLSPSSFTTPEFYANWGLDPIRAQYAWSQGYTGAGVKLGIADGAFQFTHPEFAARVCSSGVLPILIPGISLARPGNTHSWYACHGVGWGGSQQRGHDGRRI